MFSEIICEDDVNGLVSFFLDELKGRFGPQEFVKAAQLGSKEVILGQFDRFAPQSLLFEDVVQEATQYGHSDLLSSLRDQLGEEYPLAAELRGLFRSGSKRILEEALKPNFLDLIKTCRDSLVQADATLLAQLFSISPVPSFLYASRTFLTAASAPQPETLFFWLNIFRPSLDLLREGLIRAAGDADRLPTLLRLVNPNMRPRPNYLIDPNPPLILNPLFYRGLFLDTYTYSCSFSILQYILETLNLYDWNDFVDGELFSKSHPLSSGDASIPLRLQTFTSLVRLKFPFDRRWEEVKNWLWFLDVWVPTDATLRHFSDLRCVSLKARPRGFRLVTSFAPQGILFQLNSPRAHPRPRWRTCSEAQIRLILAHGAHFYPGFLAALTEKGYRGSFIAEMARMGAT